MSGKKAGFLATLGVLLSLGMWHPTNAQEVQTQESTKMEHTIHKAPIQNQDAAIQDSVSQAFNDQNERIWISNRFSKHEGYKKIVDFVYNSLYGNASVDPAMKNAVKSQLAEQIKVNFREGGKGNANFNTQAGKAFMKRADFNHAVSSIATDLGAQYASR